MMAPRLARDQVRAHPAEHALLDTINWMRSSGKIPAHHFRMLNEIDSRLDRQSQSLRAGRVRLHRLAPLVRLGDDDGLLAGRKADERRPHEMTGAAVLDDIDALVQITIHRDAQLLRRHVGQVFAHALRQKIVPFFLEQR